MQCSVFVYICIYQNRRLAVVQNYGSPFCPTFMKLGPDNLNTGIPWMLPTHRWDKLNE